MFRSANNRSVLNLVSLIFTPGGPTQIMRLAICRTAIIVRDFVSRSWLGPEEGFRYEAMHLACSTERVFIIKQADLTIAPRVDAGF